MAKFETKFQDPFKREIQDFGLLDFDQVIDKFKTIDWVKLNNDTYEKHDDVVEDFYFFEITFLDDVKNKNILNLSGQYISSDELKVSGTLFTIEYFTYFEKIGKGIFGLGKERTEWKEKQVHMEDCNINFAIQCLTAFMNNDQIFLKQKMIDSSNRSDGNATFSSSDNSD
jgi:hypothetical protein